MDFWIDISLAVVFRLLKDRKQSSQYFKALWKLHDAIESAFPVEVRARLSVEDK